MQHERLRGLFDVIDRIDPLLVPRRAERHNPEGLRLTAGEKRGTVRSRQHPHLTGDGPDLLEPPPVGALPVRQDLRAHRLLLDAPQNRPDVLERLAQVLVIAAIGRLA